MHDRVTASDRILKSELWIDVDSDRFSGSADALLYFFGELFGASREKLELRTVAPFSLQCTYS